MEQTIIQQNTSYTSVWVFFILGFIAPPLWIIAIVLFITKSKEYTIITTNVVSKNENNSNYNDGSSINPNDEPHINHSENIIAEKTESTISEQTEK